MQRWMGQTRMHYVGAGLGTVLILFGAALKTGWESVLIPGQYDAQHCQAL
jgi:hypothetical protein